MEDNRKSYALKIAQAILNNDNYEVARLYHEAIGEMSGACCNVIEQYHHNDLPLVIASMLLVANGMKSTLPESGMGIVNSLLEKTSCVAIDLSAMQQYRGENGDGGETK